MRQDDLWLIAHTAAALLQLAQNIQTNMDFDEDPLSNEECCRDMAETLMKNESAILTAARLLTEHVAWKLDVEACRQNRISQ